MLRVRPAYLDLLTDPVPAAPLAGYTYAFTAREVLTVHRDPGCSHAAHATRTVAVAAATPADLADLAEHRGVIAGCPVCGLATVVPPVVRAVAEVAVVLQEARLLVKSAATTPAALGRLRADLVPEWAFAGLQIDASLHAHLEGHLAAGPELGCVDAAQWRQDLLAWTRDRLRERALAHPGLAPGPWLPRPERLVVNLATLLVLDAETDLCRQDPVAAHRDAAGNAFAVFAVTTPQRRAVLDAVAAHQPTSHPQVLRHQQTPWAARIGEEAFDLLEDPTVWRVVLDALTTSGFTGDVDGLLHAARGVLADPDHDVVRP